MEGWVEDAFKVRKTFAKIRLVTSLYIKSRERRVGRVKYDSLPVGFGDPLV